MTTPLHIYRGPDTWSLQDALVELMKVPGENGDAIGLFYTPERCGFCRVMPDGTTEAPKENTVDMNRVFEARAFHKSAELRWLRRTDNTSRTVLLTERILSEKPTFVSSEPVPVHSAIDQFYLLWGQGTGKASTNGWTRLTTARIGVLHIPLGVTLAEHQRVRLKAKEYLKVGQYGNAFVFDERLIGLEVCHART